MPNIFSRPQTTSPSSSSFGSFFNRINNTVQEISALIDAAAAADDTYSLPYSPDDVPSPDDVLQYLYVTPPERDITRFPEGTPDTLIPDLKRSRSASNLRTSDSSRPSHNAFLTPPQSRSHGGQQRQGRVNPSPLKIPDSDSYSLSSSRDSTPLATPTSSTFTSPSPSLRNSLSAGDIRQSFMSAADKGKGMAQLHPNHYYQQPVRIVGSTASDRFDRPPPPPAKPRVALPSEIIYPNGKPTHLSPTHTHLSPTHSRPSYFQHKPIPSVPPRAPAPSPTTPTTPIHHHPSRSPTSQQRSFPQSHNHPNSNPPSHSPSPTHPAFFQVPPPQHRHSVDPARQVDPEQIISRLSHAGLINQNVWDRPLPHIDHAHPTSYASPPQLPYEPRRRRTTSRTSSIASSITSVSLGPASSHGHGHGYGAGGMRTPSLVSGSATSSRAPSSYAPSSYTPSVASSSRAPSRQSSLASSIAPTHPLNPPSPADNIHAFLSYHASSPAKDKEQQGGQVGLGLWLPPAGGSDGGEYYCDGEDPFTVSSPLNDPYSGLPGEALEFLSPTSITLSLEKDLPPPPPLAPSKAPAPTSYSTNPFRTSTNTNPFRPTLVLKTTRPVAPQGVFVIGDEDEDDDEVVIRSPKRDAEDEVDVAVKECLTPIIIPSPAVMHFQEVGVW